jgi:DNA-binding transcriptional ArsR family regulator
MKHLDVLEDAGLLRVRREGRLRWNDINPMPIQTIHDRWVSHHVQGIASAASRLKRHAETRQQASKKRKARQ